MAAQETSPVPVKEIALISSGDLRLAANQQCWPAQEALEKAVAAACNDQGVKVRRAHSYDPEQKHGFITSQKHGMDIFRTIDPDVPLVVAIGAWQYSHHVLAGLESHHGPILTVGNWSGEWPGLVGLLNLNGSLVKAGVDFSTLWSLDFTDEFFRNGLREWLEQGSVSHDLSHVHEAADATLPGEEAALGADARQRADAGQGDHRRLRRRMHGDVQRHHPRSSAASDRDVQGATLAIRPVRRHAHGVG